MSTCGLISLPTASDYVSVNTTSVFLNGTATGESGSEMCIEITILDDLLVEFDETFLVTADSPDPNVNTTLIMATIIILDDDGEKERVFSEGKSTAALVVVRECPLVWWSFLTYWIHAVIISFLHNYTLSSLTLPHT